MPLRFVNNFATTLAANVLVADTAITLAAGAGATLNSALAADPAFGASLAAGQSLLLTLEKADGSAREVVQLAGAWSNGGTADVLGGAGGGTLTRARDGSTALAWTAGDLVRVYVPRAALAALSQPDVAETVSALKSFNDGTSLQSGGERYTVLSSAPTTPGSGEAKEYVGTLVSGATSNAFASLLDASGIAAVFAPSLFSHHVGIWQPSANTAGTGLGVNLGANGTAGSIANPTTGSTRTENPSGVRFTSAATANALAGLSPGSVPQFAVYRQTIAGRGQWAVHFRVAFASNIATGAGGTTGRLFIGLASLAGASMVSNDPGTTAQHVVGVGCDDGDTNVSILTNAATATATKTALTVARAKATDLNGKLWDIYITNGAGDGTNRGALYLRVVEYGSSGYGATVLFEGQLVTGAPTNPLMFPHAAAGVGANGGVGTVIFDVSRFVGVAKV